MSQKISKDNIELILQARNNSFLDILEHMTTSFLIMSNENIANDDVLYIIDKIDEKNKNTIFNHIKLSRELSQFQINYYYVILNYKTFIHQLDIINDELMNKAGHLLESIIKYACISTGLNIILYLFLGLIIIIYIFKYYIAFVD